MSNLKLLLRVNSLLIRICSSVSDYPCSGAAESTPSLSISDLSAIAFPKSIYSTLPFCLYNPFFCLCYPLSCLECFPLYGLPSLHSEVHLLETLITLSITFKVSILSCKARFILLLSLSILGAGCTFAFTYYPPDFNSSYCVFCYYFFISRFYCYLCKRMN